MNRRQLLAGAAATAACVALPAVAIAEQRFDLDKFLAFVVAETDKLHPGANGGTVTT